MQIIIAHYYKILRLSHKWKGEQRNTCNCWNFSPLIVSCKHKFFLVANIFWDNISTLFHLKKFHAQYILRQYIYTFWFEIKILFNIFSDQISIYVKKNKSMKISYRYCLLCNCFSVHIHNLWVISLMDN